MRHCDQFKNVIFAHHGDEVVITNVFTKPQESVRCVGQTCSRWARQKVLLYSITRNITGLDSLLMSGGFYPLESDWNCRAKMHREKVVCSFLHWSVMQRHEALMVGRTHSDPSWPHSASACMHAVESIPYCMHEMHIVVQSRGGKIANFIQINFGCIRTPTKIRAQTTP